MTGPLAAQDPVPPPAPAPVAADTAPPRPAISARGAALRSLVLPGWGQAYAGSPGRGAAYFAMEVGSLWMIYKTQHRLQEARRFEQFLHDTGQLPVTERHPLVESREDQREDWITLAVFLLFFSAADAYVAAHLADFDERVSLRPAPAGGVEVRASLPLGRVR